VQRGLQERCADFMNPEQNKSRLSTLKFRSTTFPSAFAAAFASTLLPHTLLSPHRWQQIVLTSDCSFFSFVLAA
jgi:hypothetical protein